MHRKVKYITTYYGDICINPGKQTEHFTIIPRRDTMTGEWMWFKNCMRIEHIVEFPVTFLKASRQIYYFKNESWLQVLLS